MVPGKAEHNQTGKQSKEDVRNGTPAAQGKFQDALLLFITVTENS